MESKCALETICEDTVHCFFFPTTQPSADNLQDLCVSVNKTISKLTAEHIWHKDEFKLQVPVYTDISDLPDHLLSVTCFGDNIEDEWLIVYLLLEISKEHPNLVIKVFDSDGEFLLIEAADFLPSWANPNTTENRVFIYQSNIHFIPSNIVAAETTLKINQAMKVICNMTEQTKSDEIYQAVIKRFDHYPPKIHSNIHRAIVNLPLDIATLLSLKPSLISALVNAYCSHDVIDAKCCKKLKLENNVQTQVKFTKCLYAMLVHSKVIKTAFSARISTDDKKSLLGFKLACGYRIIMDKTTSDVFSSKEFNKFLNSLTQNGYFKGNLEGSRDYKQLLENAKKYFLTMECPINMQVCNDISQLMKTKDFANLNEAINTRSLTENIKEDSEEWLSLQPDQLNDLLNSRYGRKNIFKTDDVINHHTITSELSNFLKKNSDFEGIETHGEYSEDQIEFDPELFVKSLKNMMNITSNESDMDSDVDDEEFDDIPLSADGLDEELREKLHIDGIIGAQHSKDVVNNMIQSMKEEGGATGPSSNFLRSVGINKKDILDSDDDIE